MDRVSPKRVRLRPDGTPMTPDDFQAIRDQIIAFDDTEWIDDVTRGDRRAVHAGSGGPAAGETHRDLRTGVRPGPGQVEAEGHGEGASEGQEPAQALRGGRLSNDPVG